MLSGFGGCNSYTATWTTTPPDGLTISELGQTLMACEGDVQDTENQYTAALAKVTSYQLEGNQLTLRDAAGATQVTYTAATD